MLEEKQPVCCRNNEKTLDLLGMAIVKNEEIKNNIEGVVWLVPSILGISFKLLPGGIKTCLRIFYTDYNCTVLSVNKMSQTINVDAGVAGAIITLSISEKACLSWEGIIFHRLSGRKKEIKGGGEIVCFGNLIKRNIKNQ